MKNENPDIFKISCITPIYKSGVKSDPSNYRPIATLPIFSKILERIVYDQLIRFLDKNQILNQYQFGFRKNHSTEHAILEITDKLKKAIDNKEITCGLFLDFTKAFDTVNHQILLSKMHKYGIRGLSYDWFVSYLSNRAQYTKLGNVKSSLRQIKVGVPQGSTLGPLLFLLYVNDFPNISQNLNFRMFADDTNVFYSHTDPAVVERVMNEELENVLRYCKTNKLTVNFKKTHYMIIKSARKQIPMIKIPQIDQKDYIKYLGVYIDQHLTWEYQIKFVHSKVSKNIGIINKLRHYLSLKTLRDIYYSLIYPYLAYGVLSWGNTYKSNLSKLCTAQNKCIRRIFFCDKYEHVLPFYNLLNILTFNNILLFKAGILAYQIINLSQLVPKIFKDILKLAKDQHCYNTRYAAKNNLMRPAIKTNYGKFTYEFSITQIWEAIPISIKNLTSMALFKKKS